MKFLHLADLHLGKRVNGFDLLEDQRYILEQVLALCDEHDVEAVLLAGDIYDAPVPPAAACTLLDWFLTHPEAHAALRRQAAESAEQFDEYIAECKELALYDTGVTAEYGDKLITLSTCEYSRTNGRMVVVAKLLEE